MATITIDLVNAAELERDLNRMLRAAPSRMLTAWKKVGESIRKRAADYAPISPTLGMIEANLSRGAVKRNASTRIYINRSTGTISIGASTLHSRRRTGKRAITEFGKEGKGVNPGKLQESVDVLGAGISRGAGVWVEIGVALNSMAGKYAHYIHDGGPNGTRDWMNRGIGTRMKGPQAGDKFVERAVKDDEPRTIRFLESATARWLKDDGGLGND